MALNVRGFNKEAIDDIQNAIGEMIDIQTERSYRAAIAAATAEASKSVTVKIADDDLRSLKKSNYNLCFAKRVGEADFNVIWKAINPNEFLSSNKLSWVPEYQIFATQSFDVGYKVDQQTGPVNIGLKQRSTLDSDGLFTKPIDGDTPGVIQIKNEFGDIKFGLNQICIVGSEKVSRPIFVDNVNTRMGSITMQPKEEIMVWFEASIETSTIFVQKTSEHKIVTLDSSNNDAILTYENSKWKITG